MSTKITLKAARVNAGLTQKELAEKIGITEPTIIKWEKDEVGRYITIEFLEKICSVLNVSPSQIFFKN